MVIKKHYEVTRRYATISEGENGERAVRYLTSAYREARGSSSSSRGEEEAREDSGQLGTEGAR